MELFGIVVAMLAGLLVGGQMSAVLIMTAIWNGDRVYAFLALLSISATIAFELFMFTTYFTLGIK